MNDRLPERPGDVLQSQYLDPESISLEAVEAGCGVTVTKLKGVLQGRTRIDAEMSLRLGRYFRKPPAHFAELQLNYDIAEAKRELGPRLAHEVTPRPEPWKLRRAPTPLPAPGRTQSGVFKRATPTEPPPRRLTVPPPGPDPDENFVVVVADGVVTVARNLVDVLAKHFPAELIYADEFDVDTTQNIGVHTIFIGDTGVGGAQLREGDTDFAEFGAHYKTEHRDCAVFTRNHLMMHPQAEAFMLLGSKTDAMDGELGHARIAGDWDPADPRAGSILAMEFLKPELWISEATIRKTVTDRDFARRQYRYAVARFLIDGFGPWRGVGNR